MLIFLYGEDTYRSRQKLHELKAKFIADVDKSGLNIDILIGKNATAQTIQQSYLTAPFLAKRRMIIVEDFFGLRPNKENCEAILNALRRQSENILIFWDGEIKTPLHKPGKELLNNLKNEKLSQEFSALEPHELKRWLSKYCQDKNLKIESNALDLLLDWVGNDLWRLVNEMEKLKAYAAGKKITKTEIELLSIGSFDDNVFNMTDAIGKRQHALALQLLEDQFHLGINHLSLLATITWQFKNLLAVKSLAGENLNEKAIAKTTKLHPFVVKKSLQQVSNFSLEELKLIYNRLLETDQALKNSATSPQALLDLLILA
ncbi:MAG: DNA polymerase III subunit delta [Candidatus Buchananbacteria bacterium CG10_big_fil_rev_8_21_14_0_10_42_9]|uniref:DNA-directed DNA polymerase n=1 Tax=Candidatus Buchananbacteria bacterium CG10_big_fil_rev_8_21_14_0_10_42_9 TaxID=1974526 RepID=A0A2H0W0E3_9BACT|nr:MAG: DNA polymerase III subunit delta [Candidatus Buchananbacteria bacterium CG10_big_fil_rev_8_21_14_0_10_42_9]